MNKVCKTLEIFSNQLQLRLLGKGVKNWTQLDFKTLLAPLHTDCIYNNNSAPLITHPLLISSLFATATKLKAQTHFLTLVHVLCYKIPLQYISLFMVIQIHTPLHKNVDLSLSSWLCTSTTVCKSTKSPPALTLFWFSYILSWAQMKVAQHSFQVVEAKLFSPHPLHSLHNYQLHSAIPLHRLDTRIRVQ